MRTFSHIMLAAIVVSGVHATEPLQLSLADAVSRALDFNLSAITSREAVKTAEGADNLARARLLPSLSAGLSGSRQIIDLAAYGFPAPAGGSPLVGPFNVVDARLYLSQSVLDLQALGQKRAARFGEEAARSGAAAMRETVVVAATDLYLQAASDERRIEAAQEQVAAAKALLEHAQRLNDAGVVAGIEVLRAKVQLEAQRQRLIVAENQAAKDKLTLARAIGLPLDTMFTLSDGLVYKPAGEVSLETTLKDAEDAREDLKQTKSRLEQAEAARDADRRQRVPTLKLNADFGVIGNDAPSLERTYTLGLALRLPLFEGGQISAQVMQDDAEVSRLKAVLSDMEAGVALDVRSSLLDLAASDERVRVAKDALDLAREQVAQSQDRFEAGVAGNLEVVQAQDALARASDDYIAALQAHNVSRMAIAKARGTAEHEIPTFLLDEGGPPHE
ncbi:MAG TPA: TolC family protein [Candidatus Polarisedimenticolaceae bacterium]|nr:TolC family protein [Candidatus Polarisedimenticolaceae bacterium]